MAGSCDNRSSLLEAELFHGVGRLDGVLAGVAGEAEVFLAQPRRLYHALDGEVVQRIEADELSDVLLELLGGDELAP